MYPRTLLNWLLPPLRPIEEKILTAVESKLNSTDAKLFRAQRHNINYVQRRARGREVAFYVIRGGRVNRDPSIRIPMVGREWRIARVRLTGICVRSTAAIYLVDGQLSSIEYEEPPPQCDAAEVSVDVEVFERPTRVPRPADRAATLPVWLQRIADRYGVDSIDPPLRSEDRALITAEFETRLPADYLDFVTNCDGVQIGALSLAGLTEAHVVCAHDGEYIVVGQMEGRGVLAVRKPGPQLVFVDYEDISVTDLGESFQLAVERTMSEMP